MNPILIAYYSVHGSTAHLAQAIAKGVESMDIEAKLRQIPRVSDNVDVQAEAIPQSGPPYVSLDDLAECSGFALGSPTRFGNMAAPPHNMAIRSMSQVLLRSDLKTMAQRHSH